MKKFKLYYDKDKGEAFLYPEITGYGPLRESISKFLEDNYSIKVSREQILITSGGQQGLDIISKSLVETGDVILVAGKGHENYQEIDGVRHWFDDVVEVQSAIDAQHHNSNSAYPAQ